MGTSLRRIVAGSALCALLAGCSLVGRLGGHRTRIFVSNYQDDTVSVLEGDPEREVKVIQVGDSPAGLAARSQNPLVAVANSTGDRVTLIDPARLEVARTVVLGEMPEHVAFSRDGKALFVTLPASGRVAVIDPDTGAVRAPIVLERKPKRLAVSPDGRRLYVLLQALNGAVAVVDLASQRVATLIPTGTNPTDFGLSRDGRRLLAASFDHNTITVIDTDALQPIATWPVGTGFGLTVHPTKPIVYSMESFEDTVHVLDYETGQVIATLTPGESPTYSAITADGRFLYVVNEGSDNVAKIDTGTNERLERIAVGGDPANAVIVDNW